MKRLFKIAFLLLIISSCTDEPVETVFFDLDTGNGIFIACEGNFMYGNGSLSFYHTEKKKITNQLFYARNNAPLGDVVQSLARWKNALFVVVNNSGKIYVTDAETIEYKDAITGLTSPRYIHFVSEEKAYVSDLYATHITVFNPETFEISGTVDLGEYTSEQMVQVGKYVFVSAWSSDQNVLVIDTETDKMVAKIGVPFQPKDLVVDKNDRIWVLSDGGYEGSQAENELPALSRLDPQTFTIEQIYRFDDDALPSSLEINSTGDTLFYINRGVCKMPVSSRHLTDSVFIPANQKLFYNLGINPENSEIYVADAIDYTQDAIVYRYSRDGNLIDSFKVGINPSDFMFR